MGVQDKFPSIDLPIINFENVYSDNQECRLKEALQLVDAFTKYGFCLISNLPNYNEAEVFEATK